MAELIPLPFARLLTRMFRELDERESIFDLPRSKFVAGFRDQDLSVGFHGQGASTPLGPAAGPQSQMAQNIVLAFLGGSRIFELKTVQVLDELEIGRPCIDAQTVCYNIEWSQELKVAESIDEYVKASMLIDILVASGKLELEPGFESVIFDMSVGYDLAGIQSPPVRAFIETMKDATPVVERLRAEIPDAFAQYRDLDFRTKLSNSLTLSTFHGCPPDEIERIIDYLLREHGLNCVIKLNPTLLGAERLRALLVETLGYDEAVTPADAFEKDTKWAQMLGFVDRLGQAADGLGLGLGVKFTNTLIVENHRDFFPASEKLMYLSGQPLHVLAMNLVRDFRRAFGDRFPISFSAGIDRVNFADAVALGLVPVTVCTDLLRPGGYGRQKAYFQTMLKRMDEVGARDIDGFILRAYGCARVALEEVGGGWSPEIAAALDNGNAIEPIVGADLYQRWLSAAKVMNTELYVEAATGAERYRRVATDKPPKKIGSMLELFNCVTCDKCIPVCPNDANFALAIEPIEIPLITLTQQDGSWISKDNGTLTLDQKHQIGNFDDFCNDCGNCDVFCPEDGGPYVIKPRFFGSLDAFEQAANLDGFFVERIADTQSIHGRISGTSIHLEVTGDRARFRSDSFDVSFDLDDPEATIHGKAEAGVDLGLFGVLNVLRLAVFGEGAPVNYLNVSP